jgi:TetR/AcrR family transcriptional repressor of nem operon
MTTHWCIVEGGYNGFSYADISAAIGIRKASIHHYFPTKAALVSMLLDRYRRQAEVGLNSLREQFPSPADQLRSYLNYWQTCIRDASPSLCVCAMLGGEMQMLPEEVASRVSAHLYSLARWFTSVLQAGVEQDVFRLNKRPEETQNADGIGPWGNALCEGFQRSWTVHHNRRPSDRQTAGTGLQEN